MKDKISIIICTYNDNAEIFKKCLKSTVTQEKVEKEILVIDMSTNDTIRKICLKYAFDVQYNYYPQSTGLSDSRNKGLALAKNNIVAFLDADAIPEKQWAYNLLEAFKKANNVAMVGGKIHPLWQKKPNRLFEKSNLINPFLSALDLGDKIKKTTRIFGGNSAINKNFFLNKNIYNINLGRQKNKLLGGEETDLAERILRKKYEIIYTPLAIVKHLVPLKKMKLSWLIKKAYYDGFTRSQRGDKSRPIIQKYNFYDYIFLILIFVPYLIGYVSARLVINKN